MPNVNNNYVLRGNSTNGTTTNGSLPKISGEFTASRRNSIWSYGEAPSGVFSASHTQTWGLSGGGGSATEQRLVFTANSSVYSRTDTNVYARSMTMKFCIKY